MRGLWAGTCGFHGALSQIPAGQLNMPRKYSRQNSAFWIIYIFEENYVHSYFWVDIIVDGAQILCYVTSPRQQEKHRIQQLMERVSKLIFWKLLLKKIKKQIVFYLKMCSVVTVHNLSNRTIICLQLPKAILPDVENKMSLQDSFVKQINLICSHVKIFLENKPRN